MQAMLRFPQRIVNPVYKNVSVLTGVRICETLVPVPNTVKVNTAWFTDRIRQSSYGSQRRLAPKIIGRNGRPLEPSALSLMFRGKRAIQLHEARQIADLLDVQLVDVLRHAGVPHVDDAERTVPVIGTIDKNGVLTFEPTTKDNERVPAPRELPSDAVAVRCRTARSEHSMIDGWILFAERPAQPRMDMAGRLCLVAPKNGRREIAFVTRGYRIGTFNLTPWRHGFGEAKENVHVELAAPVLLIRPQ